MAEFEAVEQRSKRGVKRNGAGRKPNYLKRLGIKAITAAEILAHVNQPELWHGLLHHKSPDVRLRIFTYLTDRRDGKPKQAVDVSGGIMHAHTTYRNPQLAALSPEELTALDTLTRKLALPAPNGPENQTESSTSEPLNAESPLESSYSHGVSLNRVQRHDTPIGHCPILDSIALRGSITIHPRLMMGESMYTRYDIFEEHPDGIMWKGVAEGRDTAIEKLQELSHQAAHPVIALNLQTSETL